MRHGASVGSRSTEPTALICGPPRPKQRSLSTAWQWPDQLLLGGWAQVVGQCLLVKNHVPKVQRQGRQGERAARRETVAEL